MLGSHQAGRNQLASRRKRRFISATFSLLAVLTLEPGAKASAQLINPYAESAYPANVQVNLKANHRDGIATASIAANLLSASDSPNHNEPASKPNRRSEPLRLPPTTLVDHVATELLPEPTQDSRFIPIQVRTPTWLPAATSSTKHIEGRRLLDQAHHEYSVAAYASAEASGWNSLEHFAAAIDAAAAPRSISRADNTRHLTALECLAIAKTAIRESKDFSGPFSSTEPAAIERFIRCHQTKVLSPNDNGEYAATSAAVAIDRYMNEARIRLSPIAAASVDAAEAMDLLAEVYLGRYEADSLPNEISLTLWRAAVQGQPNNAMVASTLGKQLARVGLYEESRWALQHSLSIKTDPQTAITLAEVTRRTGDAQAADQIQYTIAQHFPGELHPSEQRVPEVLQLSPEQFAALSQPVMLSNPNYVNPSASQINTAAKSSGINATLASARLTRPEVNSEFESQPAEASVIEPPSDSTPSLFKGFMKRFGGSK